MAKARKTSKTPAPLPKGKLRRLAAPLLAVLAVVFLWRVTGRLIWLWRVVVGAALVMLLLALAVAFVRPLTTPYMISERWRLGSLKHEWVSIDRIAPVMLRSVVAAEDADFCLHWGIDVKAIRAAMEEGANRGGSTISQQVVKNLFLWQRRSWSRKALEAIWTPLAEAVWTKRRILELYLNMIEFDEGVFGVQAAARHYFDVDAADLTPIQAARLAVILPSPKRRDPTNLGGALRRKMAQVMDGAQVIAQDGRSACFED